MFTRRTFLLKSFHPPSSPRNCWTCLSGRCSWSEGHLLHLVSFSSFQLICSPEQRREVCCCGSELLSLFSPILWERASGHGSHLQLTRRFSRRSTSFFQDFTIDGSWNRPCCRSTRHRPFSGNRCSTWSFSIDLFVKSAASTSPARRPARSGRSQFDQYG